MKNVHLIPTDKPSRLRITSKGKLILSTIAVGSKGETQNICITNDEEIKEGDWFLTDDKRVEKRSPDWRAREWHKKIILTTDAELIADGVQAIDDEFLEWFVKNPSCEDVRVIPYLKSIRNPITNEDYPTVQYRHFDLNKLICNYDYKIIIPKEDARTYVMKDGYLIPKEEDVEEETIEEYFLSSMKNVLQYKNDAQAIRFMEKYYEAKKEEEGVYNGGEVWNICNELASYFIGGDTFDLQEWFKQHKK